MELGRGHYKNENSSLSFDLVEVVPVVGNFQTKQRRFGKRREGIGREGDAEFDLHIFFYL